jgi:hypothetical protein
MIVNGFSTIARGKICARSLRESTAPARAARPARL